MAWIELHQTLREHKKLFACADVLNLSRIEMIGTLVSLWLWALDNAQDGSLAGISDKTIARVCDYPEKKAGKLVDALASNGFIDWDGECYIIHDWYDYAGKLMERREKDRERKKTSKGSRKNSAGIPMERPKNSHATVPLPYSTVPNHMKEGVNTLDSEGAAEATPPNDGSLFTAFWNAYPENARHRREDAWNAWKQLNPDEADAARIMDHLNAWKLSQRWIDDGGGFIPNAENFLDPDRGYVKNKPAPAKQNGYFNWPDGKRPLDEDDIAAIRRLMAKKEERENENCP
jgi:hypothetical protein